MGLHRYQAKASSSSFLAIVFGVLLVMQLVSGEFSSNLLGQSSLGALPAPGSAQTAAPEINQADGVEILSDTQGVDCQPYIRQIIPAILKAYVAFLPLKARAPIAAAGETWIRFAITQNGKLELMHLDASTHDVELDKAAWGAIVAQKHFPALPARFTGKHLELRVHFLVNVASHKATE